MSSHVRVGVRAACLVSIALFASAHAAAQLPTKLTPVPPRIPKLLPDLVVAKVGFQFVKHLTSGSGGTCDLFNVAPTIANLDKGSAKGFEVGLEWNRGIGGSFIPACPACSWQLSGLAPGATQTLAPRQFNNCDGALTFKVTADSGNAVLESNEHNNSAAATYLPRLVADPLRR